MKYYEYKKTLGRQQFETLSLIENSGLKGVNTVQFRNHEYIQMPTTRVFEINAGFKLCRVPKKILKRTEKNGTATYFLADYDWSTPHLEESKPLESQPEVTKNPNIGRTVRYINNGIIEEITIGV